DEQRVLAGMDGGGDVGVALAGDGEAAGVGAALEVGDEVLDRGVACRATGLERGGQREGDEEGAGHGVMGGTARRRFARDVPACNCAELRRGTGAGIDAPRRSATAASRFAMLGGDGARAALRPRVLSRV